MQEFLDCRHVYYSATAAQSLTGKRVVTLALFDVVEKVLRRCSDRKQIRMKAEESIYVANSRRILQQTALDILASPPQQVDYLGSRLKSPFDLTARQAHVSFDNTHLNPFKVADSGRDQPTVPYILVAEGLAIHQALFFAAGTDAISDEIRQSFVRMLGYVEQSLGIKQARLFADMLQMR